jgi:hypothetical protein
MAAPLFLLGRVYIVPMNRIRALSFFLLTVTLPSLAHVRSSDQLTPALPVADGVYMGLEPMASMNPHAPDALWFHENSILVRNGDFILDQLPIQIQGGERTQSASDGGFITYRGRFLSKNGRFYASRRPFMSDYVFFNTGPTACEAYSQIDIYPIKVTGQGFWLNGVLYKPTSVEARRFKELETTLKSEPIEYDGKHPYYSKKHFPNCKPNDLSVLDD